MSNLKWITEDPSGSRLICELCDTEVTVISKHEGIWVCKECDEKYPRINE